MINYLCWKWNHQKNKIEFYLCTKIIKETPRLNKKLFSFKKKINL